MVKAFGKWILFSLFYFLPLQAAQVIVDATIDQNRGVVDLPLKGTITVTHEQKEQIDTDSFLIDKKPLKADLVKNVNLPDQTIVTIYQFILPPQVQGDYILSPISVKVGSRIYSSSPTPYQVTEFEPSLNHRKMEKSRKLGTPLVFKLEAFVRGPQNLYLGQRTTLVYRISFNQNIDLTQSDLPFIHARSFIKVGDAQIEESQEGELSVQEIAQEIEASQIGHFTFGPSKIEGHAYEIEPNGTKVVDPQLLQAEAPPVELIVTPFSLDQHPSSFTGALGVIKAEISMKIPSKIHVGDLIDLELTIQGVQNLSETFLPPLSCQPGFSGFFDINDLPPRSEIIENKKIFHIELRPLTPLIKEVPSIELSSFDLEKGAFEKIHTTRIPLTVTATQTKSMTSFFPINEFPTDEQLKTLLTKPALPVKFSDTQVKETQIPWIQRGWVWFFIPISLGLCYWQWKESIRLKGRPKKEKKASDIYLERAKESISDKQKAIKWIEKAIQAFIEEKGSNIESEKANSLEELKLSLSIIQYSKEKEGAIEEFIEKLKKLIH